MNQKDEKIFKYLMALYKKQYDANQYYRTQHDECTETYLGYRNPNEYPLAYNESFNKVLPINYTILSRFMEQIFQTTNVASVKPRKSVNRQSATKAEGVLNFQLESLNDIDEQGGAYWTFFRWFFNTMTYGKGIAKCYWRKEERISPRRIAVQFPTFDRFGNFQGYDTIDQVTQEMQTCYNGPYVEILNNKLVVIDPRYRSIDKMPAVFIIYSRSLDYVKRQVDKGVYKKQALKELGWASTEGASAEPRDSMEAYVRSLHIEGAVREDELRNDRKTPEIDIMECYAKVIMDSAPYEVGSGLKIKGPEEEVVVHIGNYKTILSINKNLYGKRPLFDMGCYLHPELYWDVGLVKLTKGIQTQYDNLANLRMQNAVMNINSMVRVDPDSDVPPESLVWKPFGIIPARQGDIEPIHIQDTNPHIFSEQEKFLEDTIQDMMGMYNYGMGQTPQRQERVGVVYGIQAMGEARAKLMLMTMDYLGMRPLLKYMMLLNTFHLPSGFEYRIVNGSETQFDQIFSGDIHPDYDFAARYTSMEPALGKHARAQQLLQLAPVMLQNPYINQQQWWRVVLELSDVREADILLKNEQQLMQEMQQQQQSAMIAEQMKKRFETEGKLITSEKDFQEELALNEQEFRHDVALATVEGAMKVEQERNKKPPQRTGNSVR